MVNTCHLMFIGRMSIAFVKRVSVLQHPQEVQPDDNVPKIENKDTPIESITANLADSQTPDKEAFNELHHQSQPVDVRFLVRVNNPEQNVWRISSDLSSIEMITSSNEFFNQEDESWPQTMFQGEIAVNSLDNTHERFFRDSLDKLFSADLQDILIIAWGDKLNRRHSILFEDPQNSMRMGMVELTVTQLIQSATDKQYGCILEAFLLELNGPEVKDLISGAPVRKDDVMEMHCGFNISAWGLQSRRLHSQACIQDLLLSVQESMGSTGGLVLSLKLGPEGFSDGNNRWIHFVDVSQSLGLNDAKNMREVSRQQDILTAVLSAQIAGDSKLEDPNFGNFLLSCLGRTNPLRCRSTMVITHINTSADHAKNVCTMLSLADRLSQAVCMANSYCNGKEESSQSHLRDIANLEILKTKLQNTRMLSQSVEPAATKWMADLHERLFRLNNGLYSAEEALILSSEGSEQVSDELRHFKSILYQIQVLASRAEENDDHVKKCISQVNELSNEVEKHKKRKEELKKALADYQEHAHGDSKKLEDYTEELKTMRQTVKELKTADLKKDEALKIFQKEVEQLRLSVAHQKDMEQKMKMYEEEISRLSSDLANLTGNETSHLEHNESLESQCSNLIEEIKGLNNKEAEREKELREMQEKLTMSTLEIEEKDKKSRLLTKKSQELSEAMNSLLKNERKLEENLRDAVNTVDGLREEVQRFALRDQHHKKNKQEQMVEISNLRSELEMLRLKDKEKDQSLEAAQEYSQKLELIENTIATLKEEKAILLDRLEGITGEPQGDVQDDMPPPPPGITVPVVEVRPSQDTTPEKALSSIVRVVRIARPNTQGGNRNRGTVHEDVQPGPVEPSLVVAMVRELRSERNELRRKDRLIRDELSQLRKKLKTAEDFAKSSIVVELDEIATELGRAVGSYPAANQAPASNIRDGIDAAAALKEEVFMLKRLYSALGLVLKQEERKVCVKDKEIRSLRKAATANEQAPGPCCSCNKEKVQLEIEREELKGRLVDLMSLDSSRGSNPMQFDALRQAEDIRLQLQRSETRLRAVEKDRDKWKQMYQQKGLNQTSKIADQDADLFKWKSTPMPKLEGLVENGRKYLPPLSLERGASRIHDMDAEKSRGFDARPIPFEVKKRVQRMEDRILKHPALAKAKSVEDKFLDSVLSGDPRDAEIASLKVRLVRAEMDRSELASRAAAEKREAQCKIQSASRSLEEAQIVADQVQSVVATSLLSQDSHELVKYASQVLDGLAKKTEKLQTI